MTGAQVARAILDRNGLNDVPVERSPGGPLSDHYDPRKRAVFLSEPVHDGIAVASTAIGAHEVGHAIQHATAYGAFRVRSALWPAVAFASNAWFFLLLIGAFMNALGLIQLAIVLFAVVVLFQLVTLPVEFDASKRAMKQLARDRARRRRRARRRVEGAASRCDDVRRRRASRAVAAGVLRAGLSRQPQLSRKLLGSPRVRPAADEDGRCAGRLVHDAEEAERQGLTPGPVADTKHRPYLNDRPHEFSFRHRAMRTVFTETNPTKHHRGGFRDDGDDNR